MIKWLLPALFLFSCCQTHENQENRNRLPEPDSLAVLPDTGQEYSETEKQLLAMGPVDIGKKDSTIRVDLKYAGTDNFLKKNIYGDLRHAFLQPDVAEKLVNAQKFLREIHPDFSLIVYDAARPMSIQRLMWNSINIKGTEKGNYISNPRHGGSLHNYGAAVDVGIADSNGKELDMGCPYDYFGELAFPVAEEKLLEEKKLTPQQVQNRKLLRRVMYRAGFFNIQTEWWHFNSCRREEAMKKYRAIE